MIKRWESEPLRWIAAQVVTYSYAGEEEELMKRRLKATFVGGSLIILTILADAWIGLRTKSKRNLVII